MALSKKAKKDIVQKHEPLTKEQAEEILIFLLQMPSLKVAKDIIMEFAEEKGWFDEIKAEEAKKAEERMESIIKLKVEKIQRDAETARLASEEEIEKLETVRLEAEEEIEKAEKTKMTLEEEIRFAAEENMLEIARKLLKRGFCVEDILEYTEIPIERIILLQQEISSSEIEKSNLI